MEGQAVKPAFWVLQCPSNIAPGKALIVSAITVRGKSCLYDCPFLFGEETGRVWVVVYEKVGSCGHNYRQKTFL